MKPLISNVVTDLTLLFMMRWGVLRTASALGLSPFFIHIRRAAPKYQQCMFHSKYPLKDDPALLDRTRYTLDETVCPPTDPDKLRDVVYKHAETLPLYMGNRPVAAHTRAAFDDLLQVMREEGVDTSKRNIILDSGCGTGRSSLCLGEQYPDDFVIGIDKSLSRLTRNPRVKPSASTEEESFLVQLAAPNVVLVRAELVDFWRLVLEEQVTWNISQHFLLYPNPYPKTSRVKLRWYAHPSFPLIQQLNSDVLVIRSNWKMYLEEFAHSFSMLEEYLSKPGPVRDAFQKDGPLRLSSDSTKPMSNFEEKYLVCGEPIYELRIGRNVKLD